MTTQEFIKKAHKVHGNKYDYSKVEYVNNKTKVCIICPEHGEFWQTPCNHLNSNGCRKCSQILGNKKQSLTTEKFIEKARKIHGDKYDYSKVEYVNNHTKVCIICPEHGEFWQIPGNHLKGQGCKKCCYQHLLKQNQKMSQDEFIRRARELHGDKYDYSKVNYVDAHTKVCIICPEHGEFWQTPFDHLHNHGCPKCKQSKLEREISMFLDSKKINYKYEADKKDLKWLKSLKLDFYLPDYNVAIECQGKQHFKQVDFFDHNGDNFNKRIQRDKRKLKLCTENGIKIFYYSNLNIDYPYKVYKDKDELLKEIFNE